jgi:hypothetical protein
MPGNLWNARSIPGLGFRTKVEPFGFNDLLDCESTAIYIYYLGVINFANPM